MINNLLYNSISPVAFKIGELEVMWYALVIVFGMLAAVALLAFLLKRRGEDPWFCLTVFLWVVPIGVLFTRLFYSVPEAWSPSGSLYPVNSWAAFVELFNMRDGGMTIIGGIFGGVLGMFLCSIFTKRSFWRLLDVLPVPVLLAQSIGRWGNFFNQELYGGTVTNPAHQWFPLSVLIDADGQWHYFPSLYESFLNLFAAAVLLILILKIGKKFKPGSLILIYLSWYSVVRIFMELIKNGEGSQDVTYMKNGVNPVTIICIVLAAVSLVLLVLNQLGVIGIETKKQRERHFEAIAKERAKIEVERAEKPKKKPKNDGENKDGDGKDE